MRVFRGYRHLLEAPPCALAIGKFDGLHRGHAEVLASLRDAARARGLCPSVLTFTPNPREYFARRARAGEAAPPLRLSSFRQKVLALRAAGIEQLVVQRFNAAFAAMSADTFIRQVLVDGLNVRLLTVGDDFHFGADRRGTIALLRSAGAHHGFEVQTIAPVTYEGARISSSAIRVAIVRGDLTLARTLLGAAQ